MFSLEKTFTKLFNFEDIVINIVPPTSLILWPRPLNRQNIVPSYCCLFKDNTIMLQSVFKCLGLMPQLLTNLGETQDGPILNPHIF